MQAVILAAGRARRLGAIGRNLPKCLFRIGGRALIEYSLDNLVRRGASGITIVTGHCDGAIQGVLGTRHEGVPIRYLFNPHYRHAGSVVSLLVAARGMESPNFLILESDILYHPGFIDAAMVSADDTVLVADASGSGDEVYICRGRDNRLTFLGKAAPPQLRAQSIGEYAGIARLSSGFCAAYCREAERLLKTGGAAGHYEDLIFALSRVGHDVSVRHCPFLPWTELDTEEDLDWAASVVFPQLRRFWQSGLPAPSPDLANDELNVAS